MELLEEEEKKKGEEILNFFIKKYDNFRDLTTHIPNILNNIELYFGAENFIQLLIGSIRKTEFSNITILPEMISQVLVELNKQAFNSNNRYFTVMVEFDMVEFGSTFRKFSSLGNVNVRKFVQPCDFFAILRDSVEIIVALVSEDIEKIVALRSEDSKVFSYLQNVSSLAASISRPISSYEI